MIWLGLKISGRMSDYPSDHTPDCPLGQPGHRIAGNITFPRSRWHRLNSSAMWTFSLEASNACTNSNQEKWIHVECNVRASSFQQQSGRHWNRVSELLKATSSIGWDPLIQRMGEQPFDASHLQRLPQESAG